MIPIAYKRMCDIYKIFADKRLDFSDEAMLEMYRFETFGEGSISIDGFNTIGKKINGYAVGKKFMDVTIAMWMEDCNLYRVRTYPKPKRTWLVNDGEKILIHEENPMELNPHYRGWYNVLHELYSDPNFPHWWLDKLFKKFIKDKNEFYNSNNILEKNHIIKNLITLCRSCHIKEERRLCKKN